MPRTLAITGRSPGHLFVLSGRGFTLERMFDSEYVKQGRRLDALLSSLDRKPTPMSLPSGVIDQTGGKRDAAQPVPVRAKIPVSYAYTEILDVPGEVVAWTDKAVLVRAVVVPGSAPKLVWVWANAVTRVEP